MHEGNNRTALSNATMEPDIRDEPMAKNETPAFTSPVRIHVISYRRYDHDTEGISIKAVLDGVVALGILPGDTSKQVKSVTFESRKSKDERTTIEIEDYI
jgi:hypothetical protein